MVSILALKQRLVNGEDWVLFDSHGAALEVPVPPDIGAAALLVDPVTDALKTITPQGLVDQSLNRDEIWAVKGFALNLAVVDRLESSEMTSRELYDAVVDLRLSWQVKTMAEI